jgi:ABC-type branched-subunit amino acid transport system ATPase component
LKPKASAIEHKKAHIESVDKHGIKNKNFLQTFLSRKVLTKNLVDENLAATKQETIESATQTLVSVRSQRKPTKQPLATPTQQAEPTTSGVRTRRSGPAPEIQVEAAATVKKAAAGEWGIFVIQMESGYGDLEIFFEI